MSEDPYAYDLDETRDRPNVEHLLPVAMVGTVPREAVENAYLTLRQLTIELIVLLDVHEEKTKWKKDRHYYNRDMQNVLPVLLGKGLRRTGGWIDSDGCAHHIVAPAPKREWEIVVKKLRGEIQLALAGPVNGGIQEAWTFRKNVRATKKQLKEKGVAYQP